MVGIIVSPNYSDSILDDYFDPNTHTATEANFLNFLQDRIYTEEAIGYKVTLSNTVYYNNGTYIIADVNHNNNQIDTYDLISVDCFNPQPFNSEKDRIWRNSPIRTWLNNTFYDGYSANFKSHINNIQYESNNNSYDDDKIIMPSYTEINGSVPTDYSSHPVEGTKYPIFEDGANSRIKYQRYPSGVTAYDSWWTRTLSSNSNYSVTSVTTTGLIGSSTSTSNRCIVPILRVS